MSRGEYTSVPGSDTFCRRLGMQVVVEWLHMAARVLFRFYLYFKFVLSGGRGGAVGATITTLGSIGDLLSMVWNVCEWVSLEYGHVCVSRAALNLFLRVSMCPAPSLLQVSAQMPYLKLHSLSPSPHTQINPSYLIRCSINIWECSPWALKELGP